MGCGTDIRFFLGANSANGFFSHTESLSPSGGLTRILKGGPGSGKSTLMKHVAAEGEAIGLTVERYFCCSDPESLDGVVFPEVSYAIFDGTAPHTVEPVLCGVQALYLDLSAGYDVEALRADANLLFSLRSEGKHHHVCADRLLRAAAELSRVQDIRHPCSFPDEISEKLIDRSGEEPGSCRSVFLSGYTPDGLCTFRETAAQLCPNTVVLRGTASGCSEALRALCGYAQRHGWNVILCDSPLLPGVYAEAVLIPGLGLAVVSDTPVLRYHGEADAAFGDDAPTELSEILSAITGLAAEALRAALTAHSRLEAAYRPNTDFSAADRATELCISELHRLSDKNSEGH